MSVSDEAADLLLGAPLSRAVQLVRRLLWVYASFAALIVLMLATAVLPFKGLIKLKGLATETLIGGLGVTTLCTVLVSLTALIAAALLTNSRLWRRRVEAAMAAGELDSAPPTLFAPLWKLGPGVLARLGQAVVLPLGALIVWGLVKVLWPAANAAEPVSANANLVAAVAIGLAFPSLIAERMMNAFPPEQMPEAPGLRRLLLITTVTLAAGGAAEIGRSVGFGWVVWVQRGLSILSLLLLLELAIRALARLFLPSPAPDLAKAVSESILAALITGGPRAPAMLIRTHLGLDFARSWALQFLSAAAVPAITGTLLLCWMLSGVKLLDGDQRGIYERFGAPVKVLGPGFHLLIPWPLGRLRPVEYGTVHTIAVGTDQAPEAIEQIGAEDSPPAAMNRLWDVASPTEAEYLVADQAQGPEGFQAINAEIRVLYRTGMSDHDAFEAVYGSDNQSAVVQEEASRLATRYFSSHTLDEVMGGQRESLEGSLRAELSKAVAADHAGVEIVAVLIETIHPPSGAAAAYHGVQAAEINADASVAQATAHATRALGEAQQEAQQATDSAQAAAIEKTASAAGDAYQFGADRAAYHASPPAFLLERRDRNLIQALQGTRLMVVDSHLTPAQAPLIDMRGNLTAPPVRTGAGNGAPPHDLSEGFVSDQPMPATSTEGPPPPSTNEEAAEHAAHASHAPGGQ